VHSVILAFLLLFAAPLMADTVHIATAANFKSTAEKINVLFEASSTHKTTLSSASTGVIFSQITHGAPFDIFFAADEISISKLEAGNYGTSDGNQGFCYALGTLVLIGSENPERDLADPALSLAIANPNTAPYGRAAWEVLQRPAFNAAAGRKLVRGSNALQAYQHWHSSTVDLALVPRSLTPGAGTSIPPNWYTAIEQHAILLKRGENNPAANDYIRWIRSEKVQTLIQQAGYGSCP
jgi:molybdate transport system substrate-binding protein